MERRVGVPVIVPVAVGMIVLAARFINGLPVTGRVMVAVGENVGVKTSLANSALVNALSVLIVGVGDPL